MPHKKFKEFIMDSSYFKNKVSLILQQIVDNIERVHVDFSNDGVARFNVGHATKSSDMNDLFIFIKQADKTFHKYIPIKGDKHAIVLFVDQEVTDSNLGEILSSKKVDDALAAGLAHYTEVSKMDKGSEKTGHEVSAELLDKGSINANYKALVTKVKEDLKKYKKAVQDLEAKKNDTAIPFKVFTYEKAIENLAKDTLGNSAQEFVKKILKYPEAQFINALEKPQKDAIKSRLESLYQIVK